MGPKATACSPFAVLSPYLIPAELAARKVVNLGDGFILRAIERLVGKTDPGCLFSPRVAPTATDRTRLQQCRGVILAGANQLNDQYTVWPGLSADEIRESGLRLIPFGIGLHGQPGHNDGLSPAARDVLIAVHERLAFSSWRCPHTVAWLAREIPQVAAQLLMTGCPVLYDKPLLEGAAFGRRMGRIAVTVTERGRFWDRETAVIDFVARTFPRAERWLVLHQNYSPPPSWEWLHHRLVARPGSGWNAYRKLRHHAVRRGFRIVAPPDADRCLAFYDTIDAHFGSRLHAHLLCLSRARRSWLVAVDGRAPGMAEYLQFPLCAPEGIEAELDCDFERVRHNATRTFPVMRQFVESLQP